MPRTKTSGVSAYNCTDFSPLLSTGNLKEQLITFLGNDHQFSNFFFFHLLIFILNTVVRNFKVKI